MLLRFNSADSATTLLLAMLLLWAPIPAGSVTPAGELWFRLAAFALLAVAVLARPRLRAPALAVAALAAIALLGLVQSCRWPAGASEALSPEHLRLYREAAERDHQAVPAAIPLTLDASLSRSSALSWLAAAALLAAVLVAGRRGRHRRWLLTALCVAALIQLVVGAFSLAQSSPHGLAVLLRAEGRLRGTWANPNHLSLMLEMTMAPVAAWGWWGLVRARELRGRGGLVHVLAPLSLWLLLLAGVVRTGSRVGIVAAGLGLAVQVASLVLAGLGRRTRATALLLLVGIGIAGVVGWRLQLRRFENVSIYEDNLRSRMLSASASLQLWRRFPVVGTGLGTFEEAFPAVAQPELTKVNWNRAHNNPVELLVTGGLVGLGLAALVLAALLLPILRLTRRAARAEDRAAGLAALGALGAAGFHELLDFGLVIPANHLVLLVILGAAAVAESADRQRLEPELGGLQRPADEVGHLHQMEPRRDVE